MTTTLPAKVARATGPVITPVIRKVRRGPGMRSRGRRHVRQLDNRPDLDGALPDHPNPRRDRDHLVEILDIDQVVATKLLPCLGDGPSVTSRLTSRTRTLVAIEVGWSEAARYCPRALS